MSTTSSPITITLDRRLLEHPEAVHIRRMRAAVWLYLALLGKLPDGADTLEIEPAALARAMGLPVGTIESWLGHLRKHRYVEVWRLNGSVRVRMKRPSPPTVRTAPGPARFFTAAKVEHALGETGHRDLLEPALASHPDPRVQRALAGALAVPAERIRRSRTALFLYLLKHHTHETPQDDPRP